MRVSARSRLMPAVALACGLFVSPAVASEFRDAQFGFSLAPPRFGAPAEGTSLVRLVVTGPPDGGFSPSVNVTVQETRTTREAFVRLSEAQFQEAGLKLHSKENRTVSGRPAVLLDYEGSLGGPRLRFLALAVILPDRVLLATCTGLASKYPSLEPVFRQSLDSFKLTPSP